MFKLSDAELQAAFEAIQFHGYSALLPTPPEWTVVVSNWTAIKAELLNVDLDTYKPSLPMRVYAPKSRSTVRAVSLLHPIDLIFYTALTIIIKNDIEDNRIPVGKKFVFSYRVDKSSSNRLYNRSDLYQKFQEAIKAKSTKNRTKYVAIADIADFYPRIYQHRLQNAVEAAATNERSKEIARVLVAKFISNLLDNNSYGIPVGPYASRVLAEAVLIDVDSYLMSEKIGFVRWVDDFYFFCDSEQDAQLVLIGLAERLYDKHGLTLSALKTKIMSSADFMKRFDNDPGEEVDEKLRQLASITSRFDPYDGDEIELTEEERAELIELDIAELIQGALDDKDLVDYGRLGVLLKHPELLKLMPAESRKKIGDILIKNIEMLYPIAEELSHFFASFSSEGWGEKKKVMTTLLKSLSPRKGRWPPEYYIMWILSVFWQDGWRASPEFASVFRSHRSSLVRRSAALAIAANGDRAGALEAKGGFSSASPIEKLGILMASRRLGADERNHWRRSLQLTGVLEKKI